MLVLDAGPLVAAAVTGAREYQRCVDLLERAPRPLVIPALVITEVSYLLSRRGGHAAERTFIASLEAGELFAEPVEPADWRRIGELLEQYVDLGLGAVDASVIAACERLGVTELATLDRRHFAVVRPRHCEALTLLPA
jgi:predicted nucleic acid-binding protein